MKKSKTKTIMKDLMKFKNLQELLNPCTAFGWTCCTINGIEYIVKVFYAIVENKVTARFEVTTELFSEDTLFEGDSVEALEKYFNSLV